MRTLLILGVVALCGCGEKAEVAAPAPTGLDRTRDPRPAIVCFGDSLTAGQGLDPAQSYPALLQQELDARGYRYRVVNMGVSGETTQDGLERVPMVAAERPAVVVLEFGANDGLRGLPVPGMEANLRRMVAGLQEGGAKVVLAGMTLPPNYGADYILKFETAFKDVAGMKGVTLIPFFLEGVAGHGELMQRDGLHPTAEGTRKVAALVLRYVEPMLVK